MLGPWGPACVPDRRTFGFARSRIYAKTLEINSESIALGIRKQASRFSEEFSDDFLGFGPVKYGRDDRAVMQPTEIEMGRRSPLVREEATDEIHCEGRKYSAS